MIIPALHRQVVPLDREAHRRLHVRPLADWRVAASLNSAFIAAGEMIDACREYPIVFVRADAAAAGAPTIVAPVAVFGLSLQENLFLDGPIWRASYLPAVLRLYPFALGRVDEDKLAVCIDSSWEGFSESEGQALFDDKGDPAELTQRVKDQLEAYETDIQRTRQVCARFVELGLLREMRFDLQAPGGRTFAVEGFLTLDEEKYRALPDATVLELHRNGLLGLIHAHMISLRNLQRLGQWKMERLGAAAANDA